MRLNRFAGIIVPLIFLIVMSWYNSLMVQSYNYTIFDLGLSYRLMYLFAYHHTIIYYGRDILFSPDPFGKYIFIPLSIALYLYNNITTPLLLQIIVIASGGYAIFKISHFISGSVFISIVIELSYFLYPSTYGFMAHGGNYQVLIEGFILIGYMFYIQKKEMLGYLFFTMASLTNIWGPPIVVTFILVDLVTRYRLFHPIRIKDSLNKLNYKSIFSFKNNRKMILLLIFFTFEIVIFLQTVRYSGGFSNLIASSRLSVATATSFTNSSNSIFSGFFDQFSNFKLPFFYHILSPVLFIPLLTPYFILILLYLLISWWTPNTVYYNLLQQYPYLFASFIFIGTIHFFKKLTVDRQSLKLAKKLAVLILISSIISFSLYSPFSVSNFQNGTVQQEMHVSNFDKKLTYGLSLIPNNSTVFIQNDLPQLMNREEVFMPGYYQNETVDYAVIIPFGFSPISDQYSGYSSYWASEFQNNKSYGIYENIMGAIIYKLDYYSSPVYCVTVKKVIVPDEDSLNKNSQMVNNTFFVSTFKNFYSNSLWRCSNNSLSLCMYNLTFHLITEMVPIENCINEMY